MPNPAADPKPGDWILHYRIEHQLGAGGMGAVYKAWDRKLERPVALKVLHADSRLDDDHRRRFLREARAASALSHPGIVSIYEINQHQGLDILVMEFIQGQSLFQLMRSRLLPVATTLDYAVQIAQSLAKASDARIIHRDLKPGNVMVTEDGHTKILDFGLAKLDPLNRGVDETKTSPLTEAGQTVGTPAYMSPEQALGEQVDSRSDVFAFGVMLYEMLTGTRPFEGATSFAILRQVTSVEPPPAASVRAAVPAEVSALVAAMLAKKADQRIPIARALEILRGASALAISTSSQPTVSMAIPLPGPATATEQTAKETTHEPTSRPVSRRSWWLAGAAAALVAAVALLPQLRTWSQPAGTSLPPDALGLYRKGVELLQKKYRTEYLDQAIQSLEQAVAANPQHAASYAALAEAYIARSRTASDPQWLARAREVAGRAVDLNSDLAAAHIAAAMTATAENSFAAAEASVNRALELDPRSGRAHYWRGNLRQRQNRPDEAVTEFQAAMTLTPNDWEPANALGTLLNGREHYTEAAEALEKARQASPDNPAIHVNLATSYHMLDRYEDAAASLQRALEIQPSATTYNNLGTLRFFQGRYRDAVAALEKAVDLNASRYLYWGNLGDAYRWAPGERSKAAESYRKAVQLAETVISTDKAARGRIALYLAKNGDSEGARNRLRAIPEKDWDATMHYRAAVIHEIGGRRLQALTELQTSLTAGYALSEIANDPELLELRNDVRYHRMAVPKEPPVARK